MSTAALFPPEIEIFRQRIDTQLDRYLAFEPEGSSFGSDCPDNLREAMRYSLLAPGKRLRPMLVLTATHVCGGEIERAMAAACAVEMIHAYSLIHDDLPAMDDDEFRRGRPSCHIQFDEATAILAGDALIPLAFQVIAEETRPVAVANACCLALAKAAGATRLVGGQADDLRNEFSPTSIEALEHIHHRKTGALLTVALEMGGLIAGASPENLESLTIFGKHLGLAFQIVDDLLDLRGSQAKMGKRTGKDAGRGKQTYPAVLGVEQSEIRARENVDAAIAALLPFGDDAQPLISIARFVVDRTY
jgi:geranylgeranyl diphosphate synthase type II